MDKSSIVGNGKELPQSSNRKREARNYENMQFVIGSCWSGFQI